MSTVTQKTDEPTDWTIRRVADAWAIFRDGRPDEGHDAPSGLKGMLADLLAMGRARDLPDVRIAFTRDHKTWDPEHCPVTHKRTRRNSTFGDNAADAVRGNYECAVNIYGCRHFIHPLAADLIAPNAARALAAFYQLPPMAESDETDAAWRRRVAVSLLVAGRTKGGATGEMRDAWLLEQAITLLAAQPSAPAPKPAEVVSDLDRPASRRRQAVRG